MQVRISLFQTSQNYTLHIYGPGQSGLGFFARHFSPLISRGHPFLYLLFLPTPSCGTLNAQYPGPEIHCHTALEGFWEYSNTSPPHPPPGPWLSFGPHRVSYLDLESLKHALHALLWERKGRASAHCLPRSCESLLVGNSNGKIITVFRGWNPAWL